MEFSSLLTSKYSVVSQQKSLKTEYYMIWILLNISAKWIVNWNSRSQEISRINQTIWNFENFEKYITPHYLCRLGM